MNNTVECFLEIDSHGKQYAGTDALKSVSLDVEKGGFLVLVGPSGCGKSTLLNMIAGFEPATTGDIRIAGRSIANLHPAKRDIAMVFQSYALYPNMTVADNIGFGMETRGVPKAERIKKNGRSYSYIANTTTTETQAQPALRRTTPTSCYGT